MVYVASNVGMKKGYWQIINMAAPGFSYIVQSGIRSKAAATQIARDLNEKERWGLRGF